MLKVLFTIDVEVWCDGWQDIDAKFPRAFEKYIYGSTKKGQFGLPFQLKCLNEHNLSCVCFVEPLFATRFGLRPLKEILQLIQKYNQEVQLHLHTEWVDESKVPIIANQRLKRQHLRYYTLEEQITLIAKGKDLIMKCGVKEIQAFRAGSFAMNRDTLEALKQNNILIDSSYNPTLFGDSSGVSERDKPLFQPTEVNGVIEYPLTTFYETPTQLRHVQLGACSFKEMQLLMWMALENSWDVFVILSHNFELLNQRKNARDPILVSRFLRLCEFLAKNNDVFMTCGFKNAKPKYRQRPPKPLNTKKKIRRMRIAEQLVRKIFY